jgi:predicted hydrocarbon binding protein
MLRVMTRNSLPSDRNQVPHIKGVAMLNAIRALRSLDKDRARELLPEHLHKYLGDERIMPVAWYPEVDMLALNRALAHMLRPTLPGASLEDTYLHMGKSVGRIDLSTVSSSMLRTHALADTAQRLSTMWKQYHDSGSLDASWGDGSARFELSEYSLPSRELCWIQRGWFLSYIELTGARDYTVTETQCRSLGDRSCVWKATWR